MTSDLVQGSLTGQCYFEKQLKTYRVQSFLVGLEQHILNSFPILYYKQFFEYEHKQVKNEEVRFCQLWKCNDLGLPLFKSN